MSGRDSAQQHMGVRAIPQEAAHLSGLIALAKISGAVLRRIAFAYLRELDDQLGDVVAGSLRSTSPSFPKAASNAADVFAISSGSND